MTRERVLLTGGILAFSVAAWGEEPTKEGQALSTFENLCLINAIYPKALPELLAAKGATETKLFKENMSAAPSYGASFKALLSPLNGRSFRLQDTASEYSITVTDTGACSLLSRDANGDAVENLMKERMAARQIGNERQGTFVHVTYAVSYSAPQGVLHALVFVDRPVRVVNAGVRLSSLADQFLRIRLQREPEWPVVPSSSQPTAP